MRTKFSLKKREASSVVQRRFWLLLSLILCLAVFSSAMAIKFTATPLLEAQQQDVLQTQVETDAGSLVALLDRHWLLLSVIGKAPDVVNVVMGYVQNREIVGQYLEHMHHPGDLSWVALYDILGGELARHNIALRQGKGFDPVDVENLVNQVIDGEPGKNSAVLLQEREGFWDILLAAPILHEAYVEGVVLAAFEINQAGVFPPSEIVKDVRLIRASALEAGQGQVPLDGVVAQLDGLDLAIVITPDEQSIKSVERQLFTNSVAAITAVLAAAFAIFAIAGRAVIVEPHRRLERQQKALAELAAVAERANDAIIITDAGGRITWTNPAFERLTGYTFEQAVGRQPGRLLQGPETDPDQIAAMRKALRCHEPVKVEIRNYRKDGSSFWVSIGISPLHDDDGVCYGYVSISFDISEQRAQRDQIVAAKQEIEYQAQHDPLTDLPNRRALDLALKERQRLHPDDATIVRIDLDHFKYVNDTLGHEAGDFCLCCVADILREETKAGDLPVRVGGDEFVILLGLNNTSQHGATVARRMLERIKAPKRMGSKTIRIGASFGVASTHDGLLPIEELTIGADAALYEAKDLGRNTVRLYSPALHNSVIERRSLAREIRRAVSNEEFVPFYQPQFDAVTRSIVGVETLARWDSPTLGMMGPAQFLPVAQQLSVVDDMDAIIFKKAIAEISDLRRSGISVPKVSFNVTAQRIQSPKILEVLKNRPSDGPMIGLEILESVLVEDQSDLFNFNLDRLRDMGVSIEVDDFGSGHASIVGLMHLRPDVMKIDQRLVMPITDSVSNRALLRQIIGMATILGLRVTAEGVETTRHAEILTEMGCHTLQGYAFARPQPIGKLRDFIPRWQASRPDFGRAG